MRKGISWAPRIVALLVVLAAFCAVPGGALAVHTEGLFELDRDAVDNPLVAGDDWSNVYLGLGGFFSSTYVPQSVEGQGVDQTFFTGGGSKDVNDIDAWAWTTLDQTPDKDQIQNSYAAAYTKNGETYAYFGMDRFATSGTADIGFWFFQSPISLDPDGTFSGTHTVGDLLVLSEFTNGGTVNTITVYRWIGGAEPLELVVSGVDCSTTAAGDDVCAVVNNGPIVSPWPYTSKDGAPNIIPADAFFEGGINLSVLFGTEDVPCFSSFLAETRSSSSLDARLKDFAFGSINTCGSITVHKETSPANVDQNFSYTTSGTGLSSFTLNAGAAGTATKVFGQLHPGSFSITEDALPAGWQFSNLTCTRDNGSSFQIDSATRRVDITLGNVGQVDCTYSNLQEHPELSIVKTATEQSFDEVGDVVHYTITATNTGNVTLANVTVTDPNVSNLVCSPVAGSSLAPGAAMTCTATHTITQADLDAGHYANTACVNATGAAQKCDDEDVPGVKTPELSIVKTATEQSFDEVGDVVHYTVTATNTGNVTLANVTVTDPKVSNLVCSPVAGSSLAPGAAMTCTATHTITQADLDAGHYANTACVNATGAAQKCDDEDVPGVKTPALSIVKTATEQSFDEVGDVVHYTITATNTGNVTLANVTVTDPKVSNLVCSPVAGSSLAPGAAMTCTATHTITQADLDAGHYANTACVNATGAAQKCDDEDVPGVKTPALSIVKTATEQSFDEVGDVVHYTITATNTGNVTLANVTVTDPKVSNLVCSPVAGSSLAPGAAMTCTATHTISQADLDAGHYANTACVNATGATQKCDDEDVPGVKTPGLSLTKAA